MPVFQERENPIEHVTVPKEVLGRNLILDIEEMTDSMIWASDVIEQSIDNPDISNGTLGDARRTLSVVNKQQAAARSGDGSLHAEIGGANDLKVKLAEVREKLGGLDGEKYEAANRIFEENTPAFLTGRFGEWYSEKLNEIFQFEHKVRVIGRRAMVLLDPLLPPQPVPEENLPALPNMLDWLATGASDEELVNFLQWHNHRIESLQKDPALQAEIAHQREIYKAGILDGIQKGALDPHDAKLIAKVDSVPILISDYLDTEAQDRGGYSDRKMGVFAEAATTEEQIENIKYAVNHEINHVFGRMGLVYMDEAFAEHIKLAMLSGNWGSIDPENQPKGAYENCRRLIHVLLTTGDVPLDATIYTRSFFDVPGKDMSLLSQTISEKMKLAYKTPHTSGALGVRVKELLAERITEHGGDVYDHLEDVAEIVTLEWKDKKTRSLIITAHNNRIAELKKAA